MAVTSARQTGSISLWQVILFVTGVAVLAAGAVLEIVLLSYHSTTKTIRTGGSITTVTGPAAPPASLISACVAAGIVLILAAAFFSRVSKVALPGGYELDFANSAKIAAAIATKTSDPARAKQLYQRVAPRAATMLSPQLDSGEITRLVNEADSEITSAGPGGG